jgi:hypothetical protein
MHYVMLVDALALALVTIDFKLLLRRLRACGGMRCSVARARFVPGTTVSRRAWPESGPTC